MSILVFIHIFFVNESKHHGSDMKKQNQTEHNDLTEKLSENKLIHCFWHIFIHECFCVIKNSLLLISLPGCRPRNGLLEMMVCFHNYILDCERLH